MDSSCPSESELAAFCEGALRGGALQRFEHHLDECSACMVLVAEIECLTKNSQEVTPIGSAIRSDAPDFDAAETEADEARADGSTFGRYQIRRRIGSGGMGTVFLAHDPLLQRDVAIKILQERAKGISPSLKARLVREGRTMAQLSHPNVLPIFDVGVELVPRPSGAQVEHIYIAMPFVDGPNVRQWLALEPRSWRAVCEVFIAAGRGLAEAHALGIIHRDLKPENIMVDRSGATYVVDFGLATDASTASGNSHALDEAVPDLQPRLTRTGLAMGTPLYMAPEQFTGNAASPAADQFSFCVSLYEALYGVRPHAGSTPEELLASKLEGRLTEVSERKVPATLRRLVLRGLEPDPRQRFSSMAELVEALSAVVHRRRGTLSRLVVAGVGVLLLPFAVMRDQNLVETCMSRRVEQSWSAAVREKFARNLAASSGDTEQQSVARIERAVNTYLSSWAAVREQLCDAPESSTRDAQLHCLSQQLDVFDALMSLDSSPNTDHGSTLEDGLIQLPRPETCIAATDDSAPSAFAPEIARLEALKLVARWQELDDEAEQLLAAARKVADAEALSIAYQGIGAAADARGNPERSVEALTHAFFLADERDNDERAAMLASHIAEELALANELSSAQMWLRHAEARRPQPQSEAMQSLMHTRAAVAYFRGDVDAAREQLRLAAEFERLRSGARSVEYAHALTAWLVPLIDLGRVDEALLIAEEALSINEQALSPDHPFIARSHYHLAHLHFLRRDYEAARHHATQSVVVSEMRPGASAQQTAAAAELLAAILDVERRFEDSRRAFAKVHEVRRRLAPDGDVGVAASAINLAVATLEQGDHDVALQYAHEANALASRLRVPDIYTYERTLGRVYLAQHRAKAAAEILERALRGATEALGDTSEIRCEILLLLAEARLTVGDLEAADALLDDAESIVAALADPLYLGLLVTQQARVALQAQRPEGALALLEALFEQQPDLEAAAHPRLLAAKAAAELGDEARCRTHRQAAITELTGFPALRFDERQWLEEARALRCASPRPARLLKDRAQSHHRGA